MKQDQVPESFYDLHYRSSVGFTFLKNRMYMKIYLLSDIYISTLEEIFFVDVKAYIKEMEIIWRRQRGLKLAVWTELDAYYDEQVQP